jgi:hypothetical protein
VRNWAITSSEFGKTNEGGRVEMYDLDCTKDRKDITLKVVNM